MRRTFAILLAALPMAAPAVHEAASPRMDAQARAEAARAERRRAADGEADFRAEPVDAAFVAGTVDKVRGAFEGASEPLRSRLRSVECRSRSCRVELVDVLAPRPDDSELIPVLNRIADTLPRASVTRPDGPDADGRVVLYLSR
ncbi:MAG: hypothetical protein JSR59_25845 [Proteobacteria bacterium]|nr:hypothetical protein [Pseudomonadota bacterium]